MIVDLEILHEMINVNEIASGETDCIKMAKTAVELTEYLARRSGFFINPGSTVSEMLESASRQWSTLKGALYESRN